MSITDTTNGASVDGPGVTDLSFVLDQFVDTTDGTIFAQTVSADGMHLAASSAETVWAKIVPSVVSTN